MFRYYTGFDGNQKCCIGRYVVSQLNYWEFFAPLLYQLDSNLVGKYNDYHDTK